MNQGACGLGPHQESGEETLWEAGEPGCCRADGRSIFWDRRQDGQDYETHRCCLPQDTASNPSKIRWKRPEE